MKSVRLRYIIRPREVTNRADLQVLSVYRDHGVIPKNSRSDNFNKTPDDITRYQEVRVGDLAINKMKAWQGSLGVSSYHGIVSPDYLVCSIDPSVDSRFLHYLMRSSFLAAQFGARSKGIRPAQWRLYWEDLADISITLPPVEEQRRIADFLDVEMNKVNRVVVVSEHMRDLLTLKRERTIERILGIDSSPSMLPLKYAVSSVKVDIVIKPADWYVDTGGIYALRGVNIKPGHIDSTDLIQISQAGHSTNIKSRLLSGDVVVVRTGQAGTASVVPDKFDGCNCIDLLIIRPGLLTNSSFLAYYINSSYAQEKIAQHSVGSIQTHFNVDSMRNLDFPAIAYREQSRRVSILDEKISDLDRLDSYLERQFALLVERRQALITESVTGQIDVTTVQGFGPSGSAVT